MTGRARVYMMLITPRNFRARNWSTVSGFGVHAKIVCVRPSPLVLTSRPVGVRLTVIERCPRDSEKCLVLIFATPARSSALITGIAALQTCECLLKIPSFFLKNLWSCAIFFHLLFKTALLTKEYHTQFCITTLQLITSSSIKKRIGYYISNCAQGENRLLHSPVIFGLTMLGIKNPFDFST